MKCGREIRKISSSRCNNLHFNITKCKYISINIHLNNISFLYIYDNISHATFCMPCIYSAILLNIAASMLDTVCKSSCFNLLLISADLAHWRCQDKIWWEKEKNLLVTPLDRDVSLHFRAAHSQLIFLSPFPQRNNSYSLSFSKVHDIIDQLRDHMRDPLVDTPGPLHLIRGWMLLGFCS